MTEPTALWRSVSRGLVLLLAIGCGATAPPESTAPVSITRVTVPPEPQPFAAYVPAGFDESLIYADLAGIRRHEELASLSARFGQYLEANRPDVSTFFATPGLRLQEEASVALLASPVGRWSWVMTIDYGEGPLEEALARAAPGPMQQMGQLSAATVIGDTTVPRVAQVAPGRIVLATPEGMEAAGPVAASRVDFIPDGALVAWRLRGERAFSQLPVQPIEMRGALHVEPESAAPIVLSATLDFESPADAQVLAAHVREQVAHFRGQSFLVRVLLPLEDSILLVVDGAELHARLPLTQLAAAAVGGLVIGRLSASPSP